MKRLLLVLLLLPYAVKAAEAEPESDSDDGATEVDVSMVKKNDAGKFPCPEGGCGTTFTRRYSLKVHITTVHQKIKNFRCSQCDRFFVSRFTLNRHETTNVCSGRPSRSPSESAPRVKRKASVCVDD